MLHFGGNISFGYQVNRAHDKIIRTVAYYHHTPFMQVCLSGLTGKACLGLSFVSFVADSLLLCSRLKLREFYKYFGKCWGPMD